MTGKLKAVSMAAQSDVPKVAAKASKTVKQKVVYLDLPTAVEWAEH